MDNRVIINFTPNGFAHNKSNSPHVPISFDEVFEDIKRAIDIGVTIVHLHVHDSNGNPSNDPLLYKDLIGKIRNYDSDIVVCVSTSGRINPEFDARSEVLNLTGRFKPDMASLTIGSFNFLNQISYNPPELIMRLINLMKVNHIVPEIEVFDSGMINYIRYLIKKKILPEKNYVNLILGNISSAQSTLFDLSLLTNALDDQLTSIGSFGISQLRINSIAIASGFGVRVGLEDNLFLNNEKTILATNIQLLQRIHNLINANEKILLTAKEFRNEFLNDYYKLLE